MLSESTARLVEGAAVLGEPEMVHIKGAEDAVPARRLLGVASQLGGIGRFETTLVGRQWEMNTVTAILDRSIGGHGVCGVCGGSGGHRQEPAGSRDRRDRARAWCRGVFDLL